MNWNLLLLKLSTQENQILLGESLRDIRLWWMDGCSGCSSINWFSQTRRNLTIEFLDLNFTNRRKLCKNSVFDKIMNTVAFILFEKGFIFTRFCSFPFRKCIPLPSLPDTNILQDSSPDLKIPTKSVTVDTFNWLRRKFFGRRK